MVAAAKHPGRKMVVATKALTDEHETRARANANSLPGWNLETLLRLPFKDLSI
jgi:hypothetical protein